MKKSNTKIKAIIQVCLIVVSFLLGGLFMLILLEIKPLNSNTIIKDETKVSLTVVLKSISFVSVIVSLICAIQSHFAFFVVVL